MPTIKMQSKKIARNTNFRREVSYTSLYVFSLASSPSSTAAPNIATAVEYALHRMMPGVHAVDWLRLSVMEPREFGIPSWLPCGSRFVTSLSLSPEVDSTLRDFVSAIAPDFTALKKRAPYRPFAIALLFRAVIADEMGKLPYKVVQPENAAALKDAPAAFDPEIFEALYPNSTNATELF